MIIDHWIGGRRIANSTDDRAPITNPATGEQTAQVGLAAAADVEAAVAAAREAFSTWRDASLARRTDVLFSIRGLLDQHRAELATAISSEHGKVFADALGEVQRGLEVVEFACGIPHLIRGEMTPEVSTSVDAFSLRQPLGVVAGITPFNFPVMVPLWMAPLAIACGNTFVLKPSEKDPSASMLLAELFAEAGLPAGVFNVLHGDAGAVGGLLDHPDVRAVSFVGSTPIARQIYHDGHPDGFWLGPCLFDRVTKDMKIYQDEIFGPVLCVVRVPTYQAALELTNDHPYGNGTAIFTNDGGAARAFQRDVEVGMVGVNVAIPVPMAYHSFGGWKDSLFGDTHVYGAEGVKFYTRYKAVTVRWPDPAERGVDLGFPQAT